MHASSRLPESLKSRVPLGNTNSTLDGKVYTSDSSKAQRLLRFMPTAPGEDLEDLVADLVLQLVNAEKDS